MYDIHIPFTSYMCIYTALHHRETARVDCNYILQREHSFNSRYIVLQVALLTEKTLLKACYMQSYRIGHAGRK